MMTLWIGNDAVLGSSSQWQLKEFRKLNNSVHELFIFKILVIVIDWNFWIQTSEQESHVIGVTQVFSSLR